MLRMECTHRRHSKYSKRVSDKAHIFKIPAQQKKRLSLLPPRRILKTNHCTKCPTHCIIALMQCALTKLTVFTQIHLEKKKTNKQKAHTHNTGSEQRALFNAFNTASPVETNGCTTTAFLSSSMMESSCSPFRARTRAMTWIGCDCIY